jgi:hypothetical protein
MKHHPLQALHILQTMLPYASARFSCDQPSIDWSLPPPIATHSHLDEPDDDSALKDLGSQFDQIAAQLNSLESAAAGEDPGQVEAFLARLDPIERAIMGTSAYTMAGLGVKARHAAYVVSEYWEEPIDKIDWEGKAVRLLIEAVCELARVPLPFRNSKPDE